MTKDESTSSARQNASISSLLKEEELFFEVGDLTLMTWLKSIFTKTRVMMKIANGYGLVS